MDQFSTAISCLHKAHGLTCDYQDICYLCKQADSGEGVAVECRHHRTRPRLVRCGMPTKAEEFVNNRDALKNPNYVERGCNSLKPKDVRLLCAKLLSVNDLFCLACMLSP
jgi:hypothetical protein